ncbi:hypothetical protein PoB_000425900 [Plakobranchus ocellatus]|uniref:Uncharacterized protein n=1 Tax=Plakobranchus ocellatus TaxID=259542 RepID=A0AAV3Y6P8_9GAST|nr:hypothetical protein PoB_000425900 [Plakobranchus ocellatus]
MFNIFLILRTIDHSTAHCPKFPKTFHDKVISGFEALCQFMASVAGLEPATEGFLQIAASSAILDCVSRCLVSGTAQIGLLSRRPVSLCVLKPSSSRDRLSVRCTFDIRLSSEIKTIQSIKMRRRMALSNIPYSEVATITPSGKVNRLGNEITLSGAVGSGSYSGLYIKYASPDAGYCTIHRCLLKGVHSKGWTKYEDYNIGISGKNGDRCYRPADKNAQCCAAAENIEEFEKRMNEYSAQLAGFTNLFSINKDTYLVSALHEGRVYTMNKKKLSDLAYKK